MIKLDMKRTGSTSIPPPILIRELLPSMFFFGLCLRSRDFNIVTYRDMQDPRKRGENATCPDKAPWRGDVSLVQLECALAAL